MAYTYSQLEDITARVIRDLAALQQKMDTARGQFAAVAAGLAEMQTAYGGPDGWAAQVESYATANPQSEAAATLKAQKDAILAEFQTAKTTAENLDAIVNP